MGDYFDWWIGGGTWYDRRQQDQLASLSASQARTTSRLRSQLREEARRSQDVATRLSKLEDAVIASIELEDLRGVMDTFSDAVATRQHARDVLARIPALGRVPSTQQPHVPPDVPDYWLHPAVQAVDAGLRGDAAAERTAADEARRRDPIRTAQFLAAVAILRRTAVADDDLATLWPTSRQVSQYQRSLWVAVAAGGLGAQARDSLVAALVWALQGEHDDAASNDSIRLVRVAQARAPRRDPSLEDVVLESLIGQRLPTNAAEAAQALTTLRERVELAVREEAIVTAPDEVPAGVADLLAQIVSAGAPSEEPLVARIIELRTAIAAIGATTSIATPGALDEESLDVVELLRADLVESADTAVRGVAVRALREPIEKLAASLAEMAAAPAQDVMEVRPVAGVKVAVTSLGPVERDWQQRVAERIATQAPSTSTAIGQIIGGGIAAVLGIVLGIVASPGWSVLAVAGAALAGYGYWQIRRDRSGTQARTAKALSEAHAAIAAKSSELAGEIAIAHGRQATAPEDLAQIRTALA